MQDFKSFSESKMKSALESIKATGEDNQFYLKNEFQEHFRYFKLPTIQIDIVQVNDFLRPR